MDSSTSSTSSDIASVDSNQLVRLCKLFNFNDGIPFFIANTYDSLDDFLLNDDALIEFSLFCPDSMKSDAFLAKIRKYQLSLSSKQTFSSGSLKSKSVENNMAQHDLETTLASDQPITSAASAYSISNNSFDFIKCSNFTLSGFKFPPMSAAFQLLNDGQIEEKILHNCDLSSIFHRIARDIWSDITLAYPNNVPQLSIHEICAAFTWEYKTVQTNFEKIKDKQNIPVYCTDIGKYLKIKLNNIKRASAENKKRSGKWIYRKNQDYLGEKIKSEIVSKALKKKVKNTEKVDPPINLSTDQSTNQSINQSIYPKNQEYLGEKIKSEIVSKALKKKVKNTEKVDPPIRRSTRSVAIAKK